MSDNLITTRRAYISMHKLLLEGTSWVDVTQDIQNVRVWLSDRRSPNLKMNPYGQAYDRSLHYVVSDNGRIYIPQRHWSHICLLLTEHYGGLEGLRRAFPFLADAVERKDRATITGRQVRALREVAFAGMLADAG